NAGGWGGGGGGRIAIYYTAVGGSYANGDGSFNDANVTAYGGAAGSSATVAGAAGTIYLKNPSQTYGDLIVKNAAGRDSKEYSSGLRDGTFRFDSINLRSYGKLSVESGATLDITTTIIGGDATGYLIAKPGSYMNIPSGIWTINNYIFCPIANASYTSYPTFNPAPTTVVIGSAGKIESLPNFSYEQYKLYFTCTDLTINAGGAVNASYKGYRGTYGPGKYDWGGATYGGQGGNNPLATYGSVTEPISLGSGGYGGISQYGGGAIKLVVTGTLTNNGTIEANGVGGGSYSPGSGGSIWIDCGTLTGSGTITANGGNAGGWGGGGGGRIAIYYTAVGGSYANGDGSFNDANVTAYGGAGSSNPAGAAGTVYLNNKTDNTDTLIVKNYNRNSSSASTQLNTLTGNPYDFDSIIIRDRGQLVSVSGVALAIGDISIGMNSLFNINNNTTTVRGDWTNYGTFSQSGSTVIFTGTGSSEIRGSTTFNNLTCVEPGKHLYIEAGSTQTINGTLTLNGQSDTTRIVLDIISGGTGKFIFNTATAAEVYYVDVANAEANLTNVNAHYSRNLGNTDYLESSPNWVFEEYIFHWAATAAGNWSTASNWLGGDAGHPVPMAGDIVYFDNHSNFNSTIDNTWLSTYGSIASLTITDDYTGTITQGQRPLATRKDLTITGDFTQYAGTYTFAQAESGQEVLTDLIVGGDMLIDDGATISCTRSSLTANSGTGAGRTITVGGSLTVAAGGKIEADGKGFGPTQGPGGSTYGGTYGGKGGGNSEDATYGSFDEPVSLGSGGQQ
ncbi:MAG: hypothetical protein NC938_03480, partial [Candidatus Omnitrophica bacterium]|nr:hypothetical protein [Candidatus Omnitrophota bacterium]